MKKTMMKRTFLFIFLIALVIAVYSSPAYCTSPSPSPAEDATPTPTSSGSVQPEGSEGPDDSAEPDETEAPYLLKQNDIGSEVIRIQMRLRDLGYLNYRPTGKYFDMTIQAVRDFQKHNGLDPDGCVGEITYQKLFSNSGLARKPTSPSAIPKSGPANDNPQVKGELGDWETINAAFSLHMTVKVTDVNKPDITFNMTRTGGTNLARVETSTSADYNKFLECFGDNVGWERRSVIVTIGGTDYAASLFGNPSGEDTLSSNGMDGHTTLYFFGSTTDVLGFIDKEDVRMVMRAAGMPLGDNNRPITDYCPGKYQ